MRRSALTRAYEQIDTLTVERDAAREALDRIAYHLHLALGQAWTEEGVASIIETIEADAMARRHVA